MASLISGVNSDMQILDLPELTKHALGKDYSKYINFQSKTEERFFNEGKAWVEEKYQKPVKALFYEWVSFSLPSSVYTPDFMVLFEDRTMLFVEVKADKKQRHYLITRYKVRVVASLNPWFDFCMAVTLPKHAGWDIDPIPANPKLGAYITRLAMLQEMRYEIPDQS